MLTDAMPAGISNAGALSDDAVERAQAALDAITSFFDEALREDVASLAAARTVLLAAGPGGDIASLRARAESLEAHAALYGMPLVGALAGSLRKLLAHAPNASALPLDLVDAHIDALKGLSGARAAEAAEAADCAVAVHELRRGVRETIAGWSAGI